VMQDEHDGNGVAAIPSGEVFVQLSDLHIGAEGTLPYGADTAGNLRAVAGLIRSMDLRPAAVLLTGDLSDKGDPESYRHLRSIVAEEIEPIGCPVLTVVGNHDHRGAFRQAYLGEPSADDSLAYNYTFDTDKTRVVMCDSYVTGSVYGHLGSEQLHWLDEQLATAGDRVTIVALHHPSVPRGVPRADDYLLDDRADFEAVLLRHRVGAILCGHSHVSTASSFGGTVHVTAPATAYLLDPSVRAGGRAFAGAGFSICTVRDGRAIVNPFIVPVNEHVLYDKRPVVAVG
jgi:3',5'-cyclic-AMP phosphodiesterase